MIEFDRLSNPWGPFPSFSDLSHMVIYFLATLLEFIWFFTTAGGSESHSIHCPTKTAVWDCDIGTGHPDVPATTLLNGTWLTQERPCWSVYFAEFFARFSQSEPFQSTFRTSMRFSYFLLLLDFAIIIILRRYSDYYVLRASFILLNLVCYVWLGFSSHWIPLWIHFQSSVWNAWRDVKLVLLVFPSNNFQLQRDTAFHWDCVQRSYQWHGISTWTYLRSDFRCFTDVASATPRTPGRS